ncbi:siderophore-interacting protein [Actinomycetospora endophytica]|uniref:Siderophore-interacting protein n=1 Tax=Actinomycetospora endophytica TaxID=2291215 RepID=A0ABS8PH52_9PSEU|nr:siderophore-interacting protein [Actinomycetospora endophytica]MCD2197595.1 siderophore-interacting protein [Actinomycetospora endophytica]
MTVTGERARALPNYVYRVLEVLRTERLSPHLLRVTLGGDELAGFGTDRVGPNIKVYIPREGQTRPEMPEPDGEGNLLWPPEDRRPVMRTYTVRRHDPEAGELDVDFVVHGSGVAGLWAEAARPGDLLGVTGPGGKTVRPADWTVLVADLSGAPALATSLAKLPDDARGVAVLGLPDPADEPPLPRPPGVELQIVPTPDDDETGLVDAVRGIARPTSGTVFAWVAAESEVVRTLRTLLREGWGLGRDEQLCTGYWRRGLTETDYDRQFRNDRTDP